MKRIKIKIVLIMSFLLFLIATGCSTSTPKIEVQNNNPIPEDGIILSDYFKAIEGQDRNITFDGEEDGISYQWLYNGKDIHNAIDQNLKLSFTDTEMEGVKASTGGSVGQGIIYSKNEKSITVPDLSITMKDKWDVTNVSLYQWDGKTATKVSDAILDNSGEKTKVTYRVSEWNGTYYLMGTKVEVPVAQVPATDQPQAAQTPGAAQTANQGNPQTSENSQQGGTPNTTENTNGPNNTPEVNTCTISIGCSTILNNWDNLNQAKAPYVPGNGWILYPTTVEFTPGETVFDVLQRVAQSYGIHMESSFTPIYNSAYIEGINQLYEFDCGNESGWMYKVNGWYPNYGCSLYEISNGDVINWEYTCDLGRDLGEDWLGN